jgi:type II secretion system protein I
MKKPDLHPSGFTLLEVVVALGLMGIAVLVILQLFSANLKKISASEDHTYASLKAAARMRELQLDDKLETKSWTEVDGDGYIVEAAVSETLEDRCEQLPVKLLEINLKIRWNKRGKPGSLNFKTLKLIPRGL